MEISFKKYRVIDLALFAVILCVCEALCVLGVSKWFPNQLYTISISCTIIAIVMMRWGFFAGIHAVLGAVVIVLVHTLTAVEGYDVEPYQYLIQIVGNLFALLAVPAFKLVSKQRIRDSWFLSAVYAIVVYTLIQLGKTIVSLFFNYGMSAFKIFFFDDLMSLLFMLIAVLIVRNVEGLFVDQKAYLFEKEREKQKISQDDYNGREDQE